jgi:hypothetical protein
MSDNTMDDFEAGSQIAADPGAGNTRQVNPSLKRNLWIIFGVFGVAMLVLVLMWFSRSSDGESKKNTVFLGRPGVTEPTGQALSPAMKDAVLNKEREDAKKAADSGEKVYMPRDIVESPIPIKPAVAPANSASATLPAITSSNNVVVTNAGMTSEDAERSKRRREGMERQLKDYLGGAIGGGMGGGGEVARGAAPAVVPVVAPAAAEAVPAAPPADELIGALEIVSAELASPVDSYKSTYISAKIVAGRLAGAFMIGAMKVQDEGLQMAFTQMRFNGQSYAIDAIGLDEITSSNAVNSNVDRRYLQRWVYPVANAMLGGFAAASARPPNEVVTGVGGTVVSTGRTSVDQATAAGIAAGLTITQREIDREAAKPFQFTLAERTGMGILFRTPVLIKKR